MVLNIENAHISFDLWGTLIKSNSESKIKRSNFFKDNYNPNNLSSDEVLFIVNNIDVIHNASLGIGKHIKSEDIIKSILLSMGNEDISDEQVFKIKKQIESIFMDNIPVLINEKTKSVLENLKSKNCTMSVTSNTGFIESIFMKYVLMHHEIFEYFDNFSFSDEIGYAKPSKKVFKHMIKASGRKKKDIYHIGDDVGADYCGAIKSGINGIIFNRNYETIKHNNFLPKLITSIEEL